MLNVLLFCDSCDGQIVAVFACLIFVFLPCDDRRSAFQNYGYSLWAREVPTYQMPFLLLVREGSLRWAQWPFEGEAGVFVELRVGTEVTLGILMASHDTILLVQIHVTSAPPPPPPHPRVGKLCHLCAHLIARDQATGC